MIALAFAVVLAAADGGFEPVVLDVHNGIVFTNLPDGGVNDAPTVVSSGTYMDDATTLWLAKNKASWRAQALVGPGIDAGTLTLIGAVMLAIGFAFGFVVGWKL